MRTTAEKRKALWEDVMKHAIFEASVTVLKEHGPAGIRMDRVAKAADMATGTLYNYFKDKDALLLHVIDTLFEPYHEEFQTIAEGDMSPKNKMDAYFRLTCRHLHEQGDIIALLVQEKVIGPEPEREKDRGVDYRIKIIRILCKIIEEGIATGAFRKCHIMETAAMIFGAMNGFIDLKLIKQAPERTLEEDFENCSALILPGILAGS